MTKYVIQSGGLKKYPDKAKKYFDEVFKGQGAHPKLLWCFFASVNGKPEELMQTYIDLFSPYFSEGVEPSHILANEADFAEQMLGTDIIYMHGGYLGPLKEKLSKFDLSALFKDKVVATNSASAMAVASHSWSCDTFDLKDGFGLVPIKVIPHFNASELPDKGETEVDWEAARTELEAYGETSLPVYALEEGEFVVFETDKG